MNKQTTDNANQLEEKAMRDQEIEQVLSREEVRFYLQVEHIKSRNPETYSLPTRPLVMFLRKALDAIDAEQHLAYCDSRNRAKARGEDDLPW